MALVIDDHLLVDVLTDTHPDWLQAEMARSAIYTTSAWYYRVASAAHHGSGTGSLSRRLSQLGPQSALETQARMARLPDWIGLVGPRVLIPIMAALETRRRPNLLTAEALALALLTTSVIIVTVDAPLLRAGAEDLGLAYRVVE